MGMIVGGMRNRLSRVLVEEVSDVFFEFVDTSAGDASQPVFVLTGQVKSECESLDVSISLIPILHQSHGRDTAHEIMEEV